MSRFCHFSTILERFIRVVMKNGYSVIRQQDTVPAKTACCSLWLNHTTETLSCSFTIPTCLAVICIVPKPTPDGLTQKQDCWTGKFSRSVRCNPSSGVPISLQDTTGPPAPCSYFSLQGISGPLHGGPPLNVSSLVFSISRVEFTLP